MAVIGCEKKIPSPTYNEYYFLLIYSLLFIFLLLLYYGSVAYWGYSHWGTLYLWCIYWKWGVCFIGCFYSICMNITNTFLIKCNPIHQQHLSKHLALQVSQRQYAVTRLLYCAGVLFFLVIKCLSVCHGQPLVIGSKTSPFQTWYQLVTVHFLKGVLKKSYVYFLL